MKYRNTKRNGALLFLLNLLTVGFFFLFFMVRIRREMRLLGKRGGMPYPVAWFLGFFTLFLVPLIWFANRAEELEQLSKENALPEKAVTFSFMFCWLAFGSIIIIGPFVAFYRFFATLNRLEEKLNVRVLPEKKKEEKKEGKPSEGKKEIVGGPAPKSEKPLKLRTPVVRFDTKHGEKTGKYWRIAVDGKYYYFYRQAEAIAFAKRIATDRGVNVTVYGEDESKKVLVDAA